MSTAVERGMHGGRLWRLFAVADIKGDGTNAAADFKLGIFGIIMGEGTIPVGPTGSGRKVS